MPTDGRKKPRLCRVCGENDKSKFGRRNAGICNPCVYARRNPKVWQYAAKARKIIKTDVLSHYGPSGQLRCSWPECVIDDIDMLVLDHINDNGAEEKRLCPNGGKGHDLYRRLRNENYPIGYQTLCCNHNHKKEIIRSRRKF